MSIIDTQKTLDHGHMKDSVSVQWQWKNRFLHRPVLGSGCG